MQICSRVLTKNVCTNVDVSVCVGIYMPTTNVKSESTAGSRAYSVNVNVLFLYTKPTLFLFVFFPMSLNIHSDVMTGFFLLAVPN